MTLDQILIESYQAGNIYHGWIGAAIGAAGSILGGLFGSKKKTETSEQTSTSSVNYQKMVDDAMAAGFNPLTAIRNGGTGGYVTTHTKGKNISSGGGASIGAGIADAAAQIAPLFGSIGMKNDPIKLKSKTTGAISPLVSAQLRGSTRQAGSVVVAPRQTTRSSPVTGRPPMPGLMPTARPKATKGPDAWVEIYDPALGRTRWGVNPDGADIEQSINAVVEGGVAVVYDAFQKSRDQLREASRRGLVRTRPATPSEQKASRDSWHGGWLPSIGFNWK